MRPKKKEHEKDAKDFTHVHMRDEGILAEEEGEKRFSHDVDDIEKGLRAIYKGDDADLGVVTEATGGFARILARVIIFLLVLALLAGGGFFGFAWWKNTQTSEDALRVSVHVPEEVRSGEEVTVEIDYENPRGVALAQLALDVNLPKGFQPSIFTPEPTNTEQLVWTIGTLGQHSDGKILIIGTWYAEVPAKDRVQVVSTYRPANFNADFSSITTSDVSLNESVIATVLAGPEKATVGEVVTYTATFTNNGLLPCDIEGEFLLPEGFIPQSWNPSLPAGGGTVWDVGVMQPGASITQQLVGAFASEVNDLQEIKVQSTIKTSSDSYLQHAVSWLTDVQGGAVSVVLAGNGSTSQVSVAPGDRMRVSVQLANISSAAVSDAQIRLDFQPEKGIPISWGEATVGKAKITAQGVILGATDVGTLAPAERKMYSFSFPIKDALSEGETSSFTVTAYVTSGGVTVQSLPLTVSLNANVAFSANARYYDASGAPLGSGAFPPRVGQSTTFLASWNFTRTLHGINDVTVTATLPQDVNFSAVRAASTGSVAYDSSSRTLTWSIANIPEEVDSGSAQIELAFVPGDADVDTYGKILSGSVFRGIDAITGAVLTSQVEELTTEMPDDIIAAGKGIVLQ